MGNKYIRLILFKKCPRLVDSKPILQGTKIRIKLYYYVTASNETMCESGNLGKTIAEGVRAMCTLLLIE